MTTENPANTTQGTPEPTAAGGEILSTMVDTEQNPAPEFGDADRETEPTAAPQETPTTDAEQKQSDSAGNGAGEPIGDGGKRALAKEREARREAERRAAEAEGEVSALRAAELRRDVAAAKGLTAAQARFLEGEDREALERSADDLLEAFPARGSARRSPVEALRTGATGDKEPAKGMDAVAEEVMKSW
jgi:hypothetical protein